MKVLMINGSPHVHGCTARALREIAEILKLESIEVEHINVGNKSIRGCISCNKCRELGKCIFNDEVNNVAPLFEKSDGLIIGTPVYYAHANGGLLAFLDRLFYSTPFSKAFKVGASVISSRRAGSTSAFDDINKYFTISSMPIASSTYWNEVHGFVEEDVEKDLEGLQTMRNLGRNVAFLLKSINLGKEKLGVPEQERDYYTHFLK